MRVSRTLYEYRRTHRRVLRPLSEHRIRQRWNAQRMALARHAMRGEETRKKAQITVPKLKFLDGDE